MVPKLRNVDQMSIQKIGEKSLKIQVNFVENLRLIKKNFLVDR